MRAPCRAPGSWTLEQAQRNLQYLLDQREQRLAAIGALLQGEAIDVQPVLAGGDAAPLLSALQRWALEQWPSIRRPHFSSRDTWLRSTRAGEDIAYSMLMDLAILLGELIVRRRPTIQWGLDLDEVNGRDGMVTFRRPVLLAPRQGLAPEPLDVEAIVVGRLRNIDSRPRRWSTTGPGLQRRGVGRLRRVIRRISGAAAAEAPTCCRRVAEVHE